jgi:small subunit ribosomal protein S20
MATHKSAEKAHRQSLERAARNKSRKSRVKTFLKKVEAQITAGDHDAARVALGKADSEIMKAVTKGVYKLNTASRTISRLSQRVKALRPAA